jgi:hypothetical protein
MSHLQGSIFHFWVNYNEKKFFVQNPFHGPTGNLVNRECARNYFGKDFPSLHEGLGK